MPRGQTTAFLVAHRYLLALPTAFGLGLGIRSVLDGQETERKIIEAAIQTRLAAAAAEQGPTSEARD